MDAIAGLLNGPRASSAFLLKMVMDPPWAIRIEDDAPLTLVSVVRGSATITLDGASPPHPTAGSDGSVTLGPGTTALVRGPGHYVVADDRATPVQAIIDDQQRCHAPGGAELPMPRDLGTRTWGTNPAGAALVLVGTYTQPGDIGQRVLRALPPLAAVARDAVRSGLFPILEDEISRDGPGQEAVLDRLLDLLLVAALRAWFDRPDSAAPGWYRALADPVVGKAVRLMQTEPAHPWSVASLAAEVGVSRAALARRFHDLVGEPPMGFLTEWRLSLAADLLHEPGATVGSVASAVGYGSPFALSTAFKRVRGVSPARHRARAGSR